MNSPVPVTSAVFVLFVGIVLVVLAGVVAFLRCKPPLYLERLAGGVALSFLLYFFVVPGLAFLLIVPSHQVPYFFGVLTAVATVWCCMVLSMFRKRLKECRFIEREFTFEADRIVVRQPIQTSLDSEPVGKETFWSRIFHRFGPYLVIGVPLAYPIQRLLSDAGGLQAVLLLLAILSFPLALYILGRFTCGAYLWVYKVWELERMHGKPVVLADSE